eukprot:gene30301-52086_t
MGGGSAGSPPAACPAAPRAPNHSGAARRDPPPAMVWHAATALLAPSFAADAIRIPRHSPPVGVQGTEHGGARGVMCSECFADEHNRQGIRKSGRCSPPCPLPMAVAAVSRLCDVPIRDGIFMVRADKPRCHRIELRME